MVLLNLIAIVRQPFIEHNILIKASHNLGQFADRWGSVSREIASGVVSYSSATLVLPWLHVATQLTSRFWTLSLQQEASDLHGPGCGTV